MSNVTLKQLKSACENDYVLRTIKHSARLSNEILFFSKWAMSNRLNYRLLFVNFYLFFIVFLQQSPWGTQTDLQTTYTHTHTQSPTINSIITLNIIYTVTSFKKIFIANICWTVETKSALLLKRPSFFFHAASVYNRLNCVSKFMNQKRFVNWLRYEEEATVE